MKVKLSVIESRFISNVSRFALLTQPDYLCCFIILDDGIKMSESGVNENGKKVDSKSDQLKNRLLS